MNPYKIICKINIRERINKTNEKKFVKTTIMLVLALIVISHMFTPYTYTQKLGNNTIEKNYGTYVIINKDIPSQNDPILLWNYTTGGEIISPVLGDIDGDGKLEIVAPSIDGKIYALNGENGSLVWNKTINTGSSPALGDINDDGKLEVIIGSWDYNIYALNGENGSTLWNYTTIYELGSSPSLGDINGDNKLDIIISGVAPYLYAINGENGSLLWSKELDDYVQSSPVLGDIDNDERLEIILGSNENKRVYAFNGASPFWSYLTGGWVRSSAALGDIDGDGKLEVIVGSDDHNIYALNGEDGTLIWSHAFLDGVASSPSLGDIDGDGKLEVIAGSDDHNIYALNGENGTILWNFTTEGIVKCSPALGDIDGDNKLEVIFGSYDHKIYALNGEDGTLIWSYTTGGSVPNSVALGDIDGDNKIEVIAGSDDHKIYALDFPEEHNSGYRVYWSGFGGLKTNTRNVLDIDSDMDMVSNYVENIIGTNPMSSDTDSDGMPDGWEVQYGLNATNSNAAQDADNDGLTNLQEYQYNTNPLNNDTDSDGLSDGAEVNTYNTNPLNNDTDSDGMPDGWEVQYGLNATNSNAAQDADNDGLTNLQEYQYGTNPTNTDSDSDGMPDGWEAQYNLNATDASDAGHDNDSDGLPNLQEYQQGTNPTDTDSDSDGLSDGAEVNTYNTNPLNNDTDSDGLSDGAEVNTYNTNPLNNDTDNDKLVDEIEINTYHTNPLTNDTDSDGMPDGWEVQYGLNPLLNDASEDSDSDGLTNLEEYQLGTNPINPDTDNDSIPDGWEVENDFDPHQGMNALEIILYYEFYFILFSIIIGAALYGKFILSITFTNTVKEAKRRIEREEIFRIDSLPRSRAGFMSRSPKSIIYKSAKSSDCPYEVHGEYLISKNLSAKLFSEIVKLSDTTKPISISEIERNLTIPIEDFDIKTYIEDYKDKFELNGIYLIQYMIYTQKFLEQLHHNLQIDANNQVITLDDWLRNKGIPDEDIKYIIELLVSKFDIKITKHGELISEKVMDAIYNSAIEIIKNKGRISIEELNSELKSIYNFKDITLDINRILEQPDIISSTDNTLLYTDEFIVNYLEKIFEIYQAYELNKLSKELNINRATLEARLIKLISEKKINARISNEEIFAIYTGDFTSVKGAAAIRKESSTIIIPGYKIINVIGTGGTATVFKAINPDNKPVALKIMNIYDKNFIQQFIREVSVWQVLDHKNIVKLLNYSTDPIPYIAMELMDGNLRDILNSNENISEKEAVRIIRDILTGIKYAHEEFLIVHRDIKPENILFKDNTFKLADWGLAKLQTSSSAHEYKGTIAYSAPEQFVSEFGKIAQWTDVWQVGAVLYELIAGKPPFGTNISEVINNVLQNDPTRPENISDELWNLITQMLKKNPKERISASKALRILNEF